MGGHRIEDLVHHHGPIDRGRQPFAPLRARSVRGRHAFDRCDRQQRQHALDSHAVSGHETRGAGRRSISCALRDVSRALGYSYGIGDAIAKLIPFGKQGFPVTIKGALEEVPELADPERGRDEAPDQRPEDPDRGRADAAAGFGPAESWKPSSATSRLNRFHDRM